MRRTILLDALEEIKKITGYIERNCQKITNHTWKAYKEQILSHVEDLQLATKALTDWASTPKEGMTPEQVLALHAKNYNKTVEQDEKSLYFLQLNGHEAINAMKAYAAQFQSPSSAPESGGEEKKYSLDDVKKAHFHGWFQRERYQSQDNGGYENKFPPEWKDMDYEEHSDWFCNQYINSLSQTPNTTTKEKESNKWNT
jgi:hypothetical protein